MKTTLWSCVVFGAAVALSAGIAAGGVGDLTYAKTVPPGIVSGGVSIPLKTATNPSATGLTHPKAMVSAKGAAVALAFDSDDAKSEVLDLARIDMTGKGDFSSAVTVKLTKSASPSNYKIFNMPARSIEITKDGKKVPVILSGRSYRYTPRTTRPNVKATARMSGYAWVQMVGQGQCKFGDTVRKVLVLDSNRNMILGDVATIKRGTREYKQTDYCRIADDKGAFSTSSRAGYVQVGQPVQIGDGWYTLSADKMKITAAPMTGGLGTLSIDAPKWDCMLMRGSQTLNISGGTKPVKIPAGEYSLRSFQLYRQADGARTSPRVYGSRTKTLTIAAGKGQSLSLGKDLTASMSANFSKGKVRFSLSQSDSAGSRIRTLYGDGGKRPPAPQIEVVNKAGKVIYLAKMAYG